MKYDYVIIGSGIIGSTIARLISSVIGMTPPFHWPKFKNNKITPDSISVAIKTLLIILVLEISPYMPTKIKISVT